MLIFPASHFQGASSSLGSSSTRDTAPIQTAISLKSKFNFIVIIRCSYGFCHYENKYNNFRFRVIIGTSPVEAVKSPADLLPTAKMLEDRENIDITTEVLTLRQQRLSFEMLNYLRSVLVPNYKETGLPDADQIMIVFPRLIAYELLVVDFAIRLLEHILKELSTKSTLEQDLQSYRTSKLPF